MVVKIDETETLQTWLVGAQSSPLVKETTLMAPKRKSCSKQLSLATVNLLPMLKKTSTAIGKFAGVPGKHWDGTPTQDKEKIFKCIVMKFIAIHDRIAESPTIYSLSLN